MAAAFASCSTGSQTAQTGSIDGEWSIVEVDGSKINANNSENAPFMGFNTKESRVYGSTGCNRLTGAVTADAKTGAINLSKMGSTRMMCANMDTENKVLGALATVKTFKAKGKTLQLCNESGKIVIVLEKR